VVSRTDMVEFPRFDEIRSPVVSASSLFREERGVNHATPRILTCQSP
jgi:hypothetical protein